MRIYVCIVVATVFVGVLNTAFTVVNADQSKDVKLPLDTVLKFDEKNQPRGLAIIDQVQDVLQKIKGAMHRRSGRRRNTDDLSFTDFVLEAAKILRDYNDHDLEDVYAIIDDVTRKYINRESSLQGTVGHDMRRYFSKQLDSVKDIRADNLRRHLDTAVEVLESKKHPREIKEVLDLGNTLYNGASDKLRAALRSLEKARRSNGDILENILKGTLKSLVFDHYSNMNHDVKDNLFQMAQSFWNAFTSKSSDHRSPSSYPTYLRERKLTTTRIYAGKWDVMSYAGGNKNRFKKIGPKKTNNTQKTEIFLTTSDIKQLTNNTDLMEASRLNKNKPNKSYNQDHSDNSKEKQRPHKLKSKRIDSRHKTLRELSNRDDSSETNESFILIGGQARQDLHLRGDQTEPSSDQLQDSIDDSDKQESTERSSTDSKQSSGSYSSTDSSEGISRSRTEDSSKWEEEDTSRSRKSPIVRSRSSMEGLSIDSFENDHNIERRTLLRKNNDNDTIPLDVNPNAPENVVKLIENIEKEIEKVKEEVEYVKHLKEYGSQEKPKFKTVDSEERSSNKNSKSTQFNSDSLERDNDAFISADGKEKVTLGVAFSAHPDNHNYSTKLEVAKNSTKIVENITETTSGNTENRTVANNTVDSASVSTKNNVSNSDYLFTHNYNENNEKVSNTDKNNEIDKENYDNAVTYAVNSKNLDENLTTTTVEENKNEDDKNVNTENRPLTARVKLA